MLHRVSLPVVSEWCQVVSASLLLGLLALALVESIDATVGIAVVLVLWSVVGKRRPAKLAAAHGLSPGDDEEELQVEG